MTKSELKQLIKECIKEVVNPLVMPDDTDYNLNVISVVVGEDLKQIHTYLQTLKSVLLDQFDDDVDSNKLVNFDEPLTFEPAPNQEKKVISKFKIEGISDADDQKEVIDILLEIREKLTMWSISKDLVIDFNFKIER